jgi:hypothetical protein
LVTNEAAWFTKEQNKIKTLDPRRAIRSQNISFLEKAV